MLKEYLIENNKLMSKDQEEKQKKNKRKSFQLNSQKAWFHQLTVKYISYKCKYNFTNDIWREKLNFPLFTYKRKTFILLYFFITNSENTE